MKTRDIVIGQEYALVEANGYASRVAIVAVRVPRDVYKGLTRMHGATSLDPNGVKVRYADGSFGVVPASRIAHSWEVQTAIDEARKDRDCILLALREEASEKLAGAIATLQSFGLVRDRRVHSTDTEIALSSMDVREIAELLSALGAQVQKQA